MHWLPQIAHTILFVFVQIYLQKVDSYSTATMENKKNLTVAFGMTSDHS